MRFIGHRKSLKTIKTPNKQGASRINGKKTGFSIDITLAKTLLSVAVIVFGIIFYGSFIAVETVLDVPVNQVEVKADLHFQTQEEITEVINGYVINGFIRVDLQQLQRELVSMPWIYQASIKRKLPHGLIVELSEQKPVAYWNDNALINASGEVFYPEKLPEIAGLPALSGKDFKEVLEVYKELNTLLPKNQQPIVALNIGERNSVIVTTMLQTELIFNIEKLHDQILLWRQISDESIGDRLAEIKQADLRYSNGAAVQWKNIVALNNETTMGGH